MEVAKHWRSACEIWYENRPLAYVPLMYKLLQVSGYNCADSAELRGCTQQI